MRLDQVEIKVTFGAEAASEAVQALGLPEDSPSWQIYFCEDVDRDALLLDNGIVLRIRVRPGPGDDSTVKLRPVRRSQLKKRWQTTTDGLTIGADWAGTRRMLSASYTADLVPGGAPGERPIEHLFTRTQRDFLRDCGAVPVAFDTLTLLAPVTAARWTSVPKAPPVLGVRAERWTVDDLDFLELSILASTADAEERQEALLEFAESLGLDGGAAQESKTRLVVEHLSRR